MIRSWGCCVVLLAAAASAWGQRAVRISVGPGGQQANGQSWYNSISQDGRFIGFHSQATNLVGGDGNGVDDAFVYDRLNKLLMRVSVDSVGNEGNGASDRAVVSGDGCLVAFQSRATNLVGDDTNGWKDIFVHELATGETTRVSVSSTGEQGDRYSERPTMSYDGRYVVFGSSAGNLVADDTNFKVDVFMHDRLSGQTTRLSVDSGGNEANGNSVYPFISADGAYVAFCSVASDLVPDDTNGAYDIFVHEVQTGQTTRVSVDSNGLEADHDSWYPTASADGELVVFTSLAGNLVQDDVNGDYDIFLHDLSTAQTTCLSLNTIGQPGNGDSGWPSISPEGRFVAFNSAAGDLLPQDTNGMTDIFVRDLQENRIMRITRTSDGQQANGHSRVPAISRRGHFVVYYSEATNLVSGDTNGVRDEFLSDRRGDLDGDGDIDLDDLTIFAPAMSGPHSPTSDADADFDDDGDADLADLTILAANFTGSW